MKRPIQGFTLIELVICIVILSILGAIAAPRFLNLQHDARASVIEGIGGVLNAAADIGYGKGILAGFEHQPWNGSNTEDDKGRQYHFGFPAVKPKGLPQFIDLDTANDLSKEPEFVWAAYDTYRPGYTAPVFMIFSFTDMVDAKVHYPYPTTSEIEATRCFVRYEIHAFENSSGANIKIVTNTSNC